MKQTWVKVYRTTIFRFLDNNGYKWKESQLVFRNNEQNLKYSTWVEIIKIGKCPFERWGVFLIFFPGKHRWVSSIDA